MTPEQRQLEKAVRQQHPGLLDNLPGQKKQQLLSILQQPIAANAAAAPGTVLFQQSITSMPVPPAEVLAGYNQEITNGADRLFSLVEKQSDHRQAMEKIVISTQNKATLRGQWFAFSIVIMLIGVGIYFGAIGNTTLAVTIFGGTLASVAGVFILGKRSQDKNLDQKAPG